MESNQNTKSNPNPAPENKPTGATDVPDANQNKGNGNKHKNKNKDKGGKTDFKPKRSNNDVAWYVKDADLLRDAGSLSFNNPLGADTKYDLKPLDYSTWGTPRAWDKIPGIMRLRVRLTYGVANSSTAPINVAARKLYTYIRHANSGSRNYDSPDLMLYCMAMDNIVSYHAMLCRAYGTLAQYSALNRYYGDQLVFAMGFDAVDLRAHLADLRYYINHLKARFNRSLATPKDMGFYKRHAWIFSNVFKDSPVTKSQMYVHVPDGFYRYNSIQTPQGGGLDYVAWLGAGTSTLATGCFTYRDIVAYGEQLINPLLQDEDIGTMNGDILKAYGDSGILQLNSIDEDYAVLPTYSEEILGQIHNSELIRDLSIQNIQQVAGSGTGDSYISVGYAIPGPDFAIWSLGHRMDSFSEHPTPAEVMINSRNMINCEYDSSSPPEFDPANGNYSCQVKDIALDVITGADIDFDWRTGINARATFGSVVIVDENNVFGGLTVQQLDLWSKFDWAPRFVVISYTSGSSTVLLSADAWDYNNFTKVDDYVIEKMHETALLGAFGVPGIANAYKA